MGIDRFEPIYVVTDSESSLSVRDQVRLATEAGVGFVQFRDKKLNDREFYTLAKQLSVDLKGTHTSLIINDRYHIAESIENTGVHIGQGDAPVEVVRNLLGSGRLIGLSIENEAQLEELDQSLVQYIGVGPIKATATKNDHAPPIGIKRLAAIVEKSDVPVFAIGGLGAADIPELSGIGVNGIAVVSAVSRQPEPSVAINELITIWKQYDS